MNPHLRILLSALAAVAIFIAGAAFGSRHSALASPSAPPPSAHAAPSTSVLSVPARPAPAHSAPALSASVLSALTLSAPALFAPAQPAPAHAASVLSAHSASALSAPALSAPARPAPAHSASAVSAPDQSAPTQPAPVNRFGQPRTILSISLLKFRPGVSDADKRAAIEGVRTLAGQIPGIKNIWLKTSRMQPRDFDAAFVIEFASRDAADNYAESPLHDAWSKKLQAIRETSLSPQVTN